MENLSLVPIVCKPTGTTQFQQQQKIPGPKTSPCKSIQQAQQQLTPSSALFTKSMPTEISLPAKFFNNGQPGKTGATMAKQTNTLTKPKL